MGVSVMRSIGITEVTTSMAEVPMNLAMVMSTISAEATEVSSLRDPGPHTVRTTIIPRMSRAGIM
jgi:hypothetical protein